MKSFDLRIANEFRLLIGIVICATILPLLLISAGFVQQLIIYIPLSISILAFLIILLRYFVFGNLTVLIQGDLIQFKWKKKLFFNYNKIENIKLSDIQFLVIDSAGKNKLVLRKIILADRVIPINHGIKKSSEAAKSLIEYLIKNSNAEIINSWSNWRRKGWLKQAYWVNNILILAGIATVVILLINNDLNIQKLIYIVSGLALLIMFGLQMSAAGRND